MNQVSGTNVMKNVLIYNPFWQTLGGGEKYLVVLAEVLSRVPQVKVALLCDAPNMTKATLEQFANVSLSSVGFETFSGNRRALRDITRDRDVFICLSNFRRITGSARTHVQLLQIPYGRITASSVLAKLTRGKLKEAAKDLMRLEMLRHARTEADLVVVNSQFAGDVLRQNFGIDSRVLHPPIQDFLVGDTKKKNIILSVGRIFHGLYNDKRYDVLTEAFRTLSRNELAGWEYHIAGSASPDDPTQKYLHSLKMQCEGYPVRFHVNEPYHRLQSLYNESKIFWHAAGFDADENVHPERVEHFGMTTVEAMSAHCIPVVVNKGGQREIVQHGVNGFLWNTIQELQEFTSLVIREDDAGVGRLQQNARSRFRDFGVDRFQQKAVDMLSPFIE